MIDRYRTLSPTARRGVLAAPVLLVLFILVVFVLHGSGGGQLSITGTNPGVFAVSNTSCDISPGNRGTVDMHGNYNGQATEILIRLAAGNRYPGVVIADDPALPLNNFTNPVLLKQGDPTGGAPAIRLSGKVTVGSDLKSGSVNLSGPGLQVSGSWRCN